MLKSYLILTAMIASFIETAPTRERRRDDGSVTIENVLWAVAVIAFVAIVVAAIRAFVTSKAGEIR